jgi:quinoprotein dehydrogenase-associated probable ABC transporter substrate-binding protein
MSAIIGTRHSALVAASAVLSMVVLGGARRPSAEHRVPSPALRVCADPNNMPFSNARGAGFENKLAELIARDLGRRVDYFWWPQRRGMVREALDAERCDVIMGVPAGYGLALTTAPYYRSTYVFVQRRDRAPAIRSLDDPRLRAMRIGLHFIGDGKNEPPPAHALARRGIVSNVVGYSIYGNYASADPPARLIDGVAKGEVDIAIAWGPLAGWFARHEPVPLAVRPLAPPEDGPGRSFAFAIAMGVRRGDTALRDSLDAALARRHADVHRLLERYGVPLLPIPSNTHTVARADDQGRTS